MNGHPTRRGWWIVGGASALALVWCCVRSPVTVGDAAAPGSAGGTDPAPGAPASTDSAARRRSVEATVAKRNRDNAREAEAFARAGWTMVAEPPPDRRLASLDPALVDGRKRDLRVQIASTVPAPELAPRRVQGPATSWNPSRS